MERNTIDIRQVTYEDGINELAIAICKDAVFDFIDGYNELTYVFGSEFLEENFVKEVVINNSIVFYIPKYKVKIYPKHYGYWYFFCKSWFGSGYQLLLNNLDLSKYYNKFIDLAKELYPAWVEDNKRYLNRISYKSYNEEAQFNILKRRIRK